MRIICLEKIDIDILTKTEFNIYIRLSLIIFLATLQHERFATFY